MPVQRLPELGLARDGEQPGLCAAAGGSRSVDAAKMAQPEDIDVDARKRAGMEAWSWS